MDPQALPAAPPTPALAMARRAWKLLYQDSPRCIALADRALARALEEHDTLAEGWARLVRGLHLIWYATPQAAAHELGLAEACFATLNDRAGHLLAEVGIARCLWRDAKYRESLERVLPLRAEGLQVLKRDELGMLLNVIAGCYSSLGQSEQAFAYMYQALHEARPARGNGFEVVLYCNLAHELIQLGDYHQALRYVEEGIARGEELSNARLKSVLLINRVICLTGLARAAEALPDVRHLLSLPADETGRGPTNANFEAMALAALRAGDTPLGRELVARAAADRSDAKVPDERITLVVAQAELLRTDGRLAEAATLLTDAQPLLGDAPRTEHDGGLSLRVRCLYHQAMADACEQLGQPAQALAALRAWQCCQVERSLQASRARYQAASLQTELRRLQQSLDAAEARRRATERAREELEAINTQLSQKIAEVEALKARLEQQATRDFLTGLFNRRHLNDVLPQMLAFAQREQQPLAVAIIDLDHFKSVNDRHGHVAGDTLLAAFGLLLNENTRQSDVAFRFGGEEFCVLMPGVTAAVAQRKVLTLLQAWRRKSFHFESGSLVANTFSAGVADSLGESESVEHLLKVADDRLLDAKRSGRNQVLCTDAPAAELER
ncbi:MAG: GGDEF domain-containing protein [Rhizobacter sp.]|nr:GGDEF domain-containing protein [Rhizobacter sp.]